MQHLEITLADFREVSGLTLKDRLLQMAIGAAEGRVVGLRQDTTQCASAQ
jgi:hypothetical protein